jgi:hypothetical protein
MPASDTQLAPLAVGAADAAKLVGVSVRMWRRLDGSGGCPRAIRLGWRKLWRTTDLADWVQAGCPSRSDFERGRA